MGRPPANKQPSDSTPQENSGELGDILKAIKKTYGKDADISIAADDIEGKDLVSTGSKVLDLCIHSKGLPMNGKITELLGLFSSGKSLLLQKIMANGQKDYNAICILVDRENAYTKDRGEQLGINNNLLIRVGPKEVPTAKDAFDFICTSIEEVRKKFPERKIIIGLDSIAAFDKVPKVKIKVGKDGEETEVRSESKADMGKKAKQVHEGMRKLLNYLDNNTMFVFCNQITYMPGTMFSNPQTSTSGEASKYYPTVRLQLEQGKKIVDKSKGGEVVGQIIKCQVIKSRLDASYRKCEIPFYFATGIPTWGGYLKLLADRNIIGVNTKKGDNAYKIFEYKGEKYKIDQFADMMKKYPELIFDTYPEYGSFSETPELEDEDNE